MSFSSLPHVVHEARVLPILAAPRPLGLRQGDSTQVRGANALHCCTCICWAFGQLQVVYPVIYHIILDIYRPGTLCLVHICLI